MRNYRLGRNGGHLRAGTYIGYAAREVAFGRDEATRAYEVEAYTTRSIVSTIQEHRWNDDVDMVNGGHVRVYFTEEAASSAKKDLERARASSLDLKAVRWIGKEEMETVKQFPIVEVACSPQACHRNLDYPTRECPHPHTIFGR